MATDTELQFDVLQELKWEPSVSATGIGVAVKDGVVTLSGTVDIYVDRSNAAPNPAGFVQTYALVPNSDSYTEVMP